MSFGGVLSPVRSRALAARRRERLFKKINENSTVYKTLASGDSSKGGAKKKVRQQRIPSPRAARRQRGR